MSESVVILKCLLLHNLIELSEAYGLSFPTFLKSTKQLVKLIAGTTLAEMPNSGLSWNLLSQSIIDTRSLHFWVLSSTNPQDFIIRLCQYTALETVGISFGHLKNGAGAIAIGGFRNFVAQELATTIAYNSTKIQALTAIEKKAIAIAALVVKKGRSTIPEILKLKGGSQNEYLKPMVLKPLDARTVAFQNDCRIIIENMFREHSMRRALNGSARQIYTNPLLVSIVGSASSLNILPIIGWTIFSFTLTVGLIGLTLHMFQRAERYRYENIIDIHYAEDFDFF